MSLWCTNTIMRHFLCGEFSLGRVRSRSGVLRVSSCTFRSLSRHRSLRTILAHYDFVIVSPWSRTQHLSLTSHFLSDLCAKAIDRCIILYTAMSKNLGGSICPWSRTSYSNSSFEIIISQASTYFATWYINEWRVCLVCSWTRWIFGPNKRGWSFKTKRIRHSS